jgi:hypothetical protein
LFFNFRHWIFRLTRRHIATLTAPVAQPDRATDF